MRGAQLALAAAITMAAAGTALAAGVDGSGHEPYWLRDPQTQCYVFYLDRHPADFVTWSGDCVEGAASGNGTATFIDRGRFVESISGPFLKGAADGAIRVTWADGSHFEGTEAAGRFNGAGVLTHANGDRFEGQWSNNRLNGHGTVVWANGDRYEGELRDSKAEGHGVQVWADGRKYDGAWKDDLPNGHGVLTRKGGSIFEGEFVDGAPQAPATASADAGAPKPAATAPAIPTAAMTGGTNVNAASPSPASPAPAWLASVAGAKVVAVDGTGMALSLSPVGMVRETIAPGGASQKTWFTFLNSRQGTVSDGADAAKVTGVFRIADPGVAIDYADGRSEFVQPNGAGGIAVTTTIPGQASFCTAWYPLGHSFTAADREAALAAYATRLGVSSAKHKSAACAAPTSDTGKTEASAHASGKPAYNRHSTPDRTAAAEPVARAPMQAVAVRESQVHAIDAPSVPLAQQPAPEHSADARPLPTAPATPSACLSVESDGASLGFRNHCGFDVQFAWCVPAASDAAKSCSSGGVPGTVSANGFGRLFAQAGLNTSEYDLRWIACSAASGDVHPRLVRSDPPAGECVHVRG